MNKETRKESSIPVQARISIVDLAKMCAYWEIKEQVVIKSMSQLVGWTFSAMCDVIEANDKMVGNINSVAEANRYLQARGLYQQSLKKRSESRITAALGFENLRDQGLDPAVHSPFAHKVIHSAHGAESFNGQVSVNKQVEITSNDEWDRMQERIAEENEKDRVEELNNAKDSNIVVNESKGVTLKEGMSDEELSEYNRKKDEERVKVENKPIKAEDFELVEEVT